MVGLPLPATPYRLQSGVRSCIWAAFANWRGAGGAVQYGQKSSEAGRGRPQALHILSRGSAAYPPNEKS